MKSENTTSVAVESSQLMSLFEDQLKDIYWAENALVKALPKMIENASSKKLTDALKSHLEETEKQVERLKEVFDCIDKKPVGKKCDAMEGLLKEADSIMESSEPGAMCDAGIISAGQKVEHYEIATYGTLCAFAKALGEDDAEALLQETLDEEKVADIKLSEIAESINREAAGQAESK